MMLRSSTPLLLALPLALAAGCGDDAPATDTDGGSDGADPVAVTYFDDVAPIFIESCNGCHTDGGVAPFSLETYDEAKAWGAAVQVAATNRTMPPFNVNNDGSCNTYAHARWLSDEQIGTIAAWVDGGMEAGDPATVLPPAPTPRVLQGSEIREVQTPGDYVPTSEGIPSAMFDDYQCFLIELDLADTQFLTGYDVIPGNPAILHHLIGFNVDPQRQSLLDPFGRTNDEVMAELDAASPGVPGWNCFGAAGEGVMIEGAPVSWAPGAGATNFPAGTGIRFEPGQVLVVQTHYNLAEMGGLDQSTVQLSYAAEVEREARLTLFDDFLFTSVIGEPAALPPGQEAASYEWGGNLGQVTLSSGSGPAQVLGILPHMHQRGRRMQVDFTIDGQTRCGADVDRWDFNWQQAYFYEEPIDMMLSDRVDVRCEWDTRGDTDPVMPGFGTDNEMCLIGLYVAEG